MSKHNGGITHYDFMSLDANGRPTAQCADCNKILPLVINGTYHIEVGDGGEVSGISCSACYARLKRAKRRKGKN